MHIPSQRPESVKCWHCFVALGITQVTGGSSMAGGPEEKPKNQDPPRLEDQRLPKPGCRSDPFLLHYNWFSPRLLQPGGAARMGVLQRSCCWNTAPASQIPSANISQVDLDTTMSPSHLLQPHPGNISPTGTSSESNSQLVSPDSIHSKQGSSLQLQQFLVNLISRTRWMPQL